MARFVCKPTVGGNNIETYKIAATITDLDIDKPVKLSATDKVALCADGDAIYGFIVSVEPNLADGDKIVGVQIDGRKYVILSGAAAVGTLVEAAANEAAGVAKAGAYGIVSVHVAVTTTTDTLAASTFSKNWRVISGTGLDTSTALIEKQ